MQQPITDLGRSMSGFLQQLIDKSEQSDEKLFKTTDPSLNVDTRSAATLTALTREEDLADAQNSGLFDEQFYLASYPDIATADITSLEHFLNYGYLEDRRPNFYFQPRWYLATNDDVRSAKSHPFLHYIRYGDREGRRPGPFFDTAWYRARYNIAKDELALAHYLRFRKTGQVSPLPDFDVEFYLEHSADVQAAGVDPFEHFLLWGYKEGRAPSEGFDVKFYAKRYLNGDLNENPFIHYLQHKDTPGIFGRLPDHEATIPREIKKFTRPSVEFEEFRPIPPSSSRRAMILAYYLPQFHSFPENDKWWGKGFTEWTNVVRGVPRFKGHYQPRVPRDLGFYSLENLSAMERQVRMALASGVSGFVFYYYWFNGKRLMERPLDQFLQESSLQMPFCLMWANENWTRRWDGSESEVLISQDYMPDDDEKLVADFARHFADARYIRIDGRPLLMIYRPRIIPETGKTIARWRRLFQRLHHDNPILVMAQSFGETDPREIGFDGAIEFPPHKLTQHLTPVNSQLELLDDDFRGKVYRYEDVIRVSLDEPPPAYPLIKTAVPSWDNDARRQGSGLTITGSTPARYEAWLRELVARAVERPFFGTPIVCINAWNEWCEGAYLEPDLHFGAAYLNATARAVTGTAQRTEVPKLLLIGHDAFPSGAQLLLLNIGRSLRRHFGIEFEFLLLDGGKLEDQYREVAPTVIVGSGYGLEGKLATYFERGFRNAIVNTTASASILRKLRSAGLEAVVLVHELPRIIREKRLTDGALAAMEEARHVVFPAAYVRDELLRELQVEDNARCLVLPQGVYQELKPDARAGFGFRQELGIGEGECLVIGVGYADLRKGFDLFLQLWWHLNGNAGQRTRRFHLAWIGNIDANLKEWLSAEIDSATETGTFHMVGYRSDMDAVFSAADACALTSREDPFPSVVLEALQMGVRAFAFDRSGGIPGLLREFEPGSIAPYADVAAMAQAIAAYFDAPRDPAQARKRQELAQSKFSFKTYVRELLNLAVPQLPKVSVIVPNYNYARYMEERLASIFSQHFPVCEVIVLDDASTDNSLEVISKVAAVWQREVSVVANEKNSGSVFAQWRKGTELAQGEYVWIAEADDLSEPGFLARLLALMAPDSRIVMAFSDSRTINADGSSQWASYKPYYATVEPGALDETRVFDAAEFAARLLSIKNLILNVSSVVWRRDALLQVLRSCEEVLPAFRMAGDWRLYLEALSLPEARVAYEAEPLNVHRRHAQSVTHALDAERHVAEIAACHQVARERFHLASALVLRQSDYQGEVRAQLTAAPPHTQQKASADRPEKGAKTPPKGKRKPAAAAMRIQKAQRA